MIIQELTDELTAMEKLSEEIARADTLDERITALHDALRERVSMQKALQKLLESEEVTPERRVAQYFYGVEFPPKDLRMGLVEASQGKIGNAVDQVLLYCYHYDPATGKYGAIINNILKLGAGLTVLILGALILILFRLEKVGPRRSWNQAEVRR